MRSAVTYITGGGEEETEGRDRSWSKAGPCRILPCTCSSCGPVPGVSSPRLNRWGLFLQRQGARYNMFCERKTGGWYLWPEETYHTKASINNTGFLADWSSVRGKRDLIQEQGRDICTRLISARVESQISQVQNALIQSRLRSISGDPPVPLFLIPADTARRRFRPFLSLRASTPGPTSSRRAFATADSPDNNLFITTASARRMGFPISGAHFGLPLPSLASGNRGRGGWVWGNGSQINK